MRHRLPTVAAIVVLTATLVAAPAAAQEGPTVTTQVVESFDGTPIVTTLFLPDGASEDAPVPLVLRTHGWGGSRETSVGGTLEALLDDGYAVLTWDQRGFGCSGGIVQVDKPDVEGRDVSALIDWAVANAPIATDGTVDGAPDPVVGMTGGSYAGGIQTATASIDPRLDALAPEISWQDLRYSLYAGSVTNQGWGTLLYGLGEATANGDGLDPSCEAGPQQGGLAPEIEQAFAEFVTTNDVSDESRAFFAASSIAGYGDDNPVAVPTLVMNGSVDTLFDLTDGWRIVEHVRGQDAPARFIAFCGGHVACPPSYADADDRAHLDAAILDWFARYLRGEDVDTGAPVEYRTNEGEWHSAMSFPPPQFDELTASGEGELVGTADVEIPDPQALAEGLAGFEGGIPGTPLTTAAPSRDGDPRAMTVEVAATEDGPIELVGIPTATLEVSGTGPAVHLFVKLVDREAGEVVNLQETPLRVTDLSDEVQTFQIPMSGLAYTLAEGHHLDLQVSTASTMHATARTPSQVAVAASVTVPVDVPPAPAPDDAGDDETDAPAEEQDEAVAAAAAAMPATGGGTGLLAPLLAVLAALVWRRRIALRG